MPQRSNRFQKIVFMLQKQLAGSAKVTESKLMANRDTGGATEVDVVIEGQAGGIPITIGVECQGRGRIASVEWVDQVHGKHAALAINKSVLVAKAGFTKGARKAARARNMETLTLSQAEATQWREYVGDLGKLLLGRCEVSAKGGTLHFSQEGPPVTSLGDQSAIRIYLDDAEYGVVTFTDLILKNPRLIPDVTKMWHAMPPAERPTEFDCLMKWRPKVAARIRGADGLMRSLGGFDLVVHVEFETGPLSLEAADYGGQTIAHGSVKNILAESDDKQRDVLVTVIKSDDGPPKIAMMVPMLDGSDFVLESVLVRRE